ncbi:MAG: hypothetical protein JNK16_06245 [Phycisphaerales bacterium]|nr:hypothetical protein [Phycisphaerales bacterium]
MASSLPQFDPVAINAKPPALKLTRFFVLAFLVFFIIDFVSIFTASAIAGSNWMLQLNGGCVEFSLGEPVPGASGGAIRFTFWFPIWNPTYFYLSGGKGPAVSFVLVFPIWIFSLLCAAMALITFHRGVCRADLCSNCRYDILSQSTNTCPECGKPIYPGIAQLPASKSLRGFASVYKNIIVVSASLTGLGLALVLGMRVLIWTGEKETTLIIPTGYVGTVVFVEDEKGVAPEGSWGRHVYRVPNSGVLRVTDIAAVKHYPSTPSTRIHFICREEDGTEIQTEGPRTNGKKWFRIDGPYGQPGISIAQFGLGSEYLPRELRISPEEEQKLRENGVPSDFIAPHRLLKKGETLPKDAGRP